MTTSLASLRDIVLRHSVEGSLLMPIPRLTLHRSGRVTAPVQALHRPALCIVLQGGKRAFLGAQVYDYNVESYLILSVDLPLTSAIVEADIERPYLGLSLELDAATLSSLILQMAGEALDAEVVPGLMQSPIEADLLDPLFRLLQLLDRPDDLPVLGPLIEREVLFRLLRGPQSAMLRVLTDEDSRMARIERAASWIRRNYAKPLRIGTLASLAGMSSSTFHQHFKTMTEMTPLNYQKQVRLQEARRMLLSNPTSTAQIGLSVGYGSPSQFSREYRRMFGIPPAADAVFLRNAQAVAS